MSHYIERWCPTHGEWQMDVNNVGECPTCPDLLTTLRAECAAVREECARWRSLVTQWADWKRGGVQGAGRTWDAREAALIAALAPPAAEEEK